MQAQEQVQSKSIKTGKTGKIIQSQDQVQTQAQEQIQSKLTKGGKATGKYNTDYL